MKELTKLYRRELAFIFVTSVLVYLDWSWGDDGFLDRTYIYPFLILLSLPCLIALRYGNRAVNLISRSCVPIGVWVSAVIAIDVLSNIGGVEGAMVGAKMIFMPLGLGIIYSYLFSMLEKNQVENSPFSISKKEGFLIGTIAASLQLFIIIHLFPIIPIDVQPALISVGVIVVCFNHQRFEHLSDPEIFNRASLFICIIAAVLGVGLYSNGVAAGLTAMGPAAFITFSLSTIGAGLAYTTVLIGGQKSYSEKEARYFDWHLVESWAFITLMINPPTTLVESFGNLS